jgi:hypothetical protein
MRKAMRSEEARGRNGLVSRVSGDANLAVGKAHGYGES